MEDTGQPTFETKGVKEQGWYLVDEEAYILSLESSFSNLMLLVTENVTSGFLEDTEQPVLGLEIIVDWF